MKHGAMGNGLFVFSNVIKHPSELDITASRYRVGSASTALESTSRPR
jgi:hypothetical protein